MTSLATQLNALKLQQKDALAVPKRARISLLFDAKTAANIDDQTLYYICKAGMQQLAHAGQLDLSAFEGDILNEKSLTYYRGTETKDTNQLIDEQVGALLKALAPWLLEQAALKVVEYLIRIYEAHIFHKQTLILAFMPLFETVYFLRAIQCFSLKDDSVWGWLSEFAYQGQSIDKQTLVKCVSRNNGLVFCLCAEFALEVKGDLHIKWFGVFLTESLKVSASEGLMFGILPLLSKAIRQDHRDLRLSCFLALSQLACRRVLTTEYISAFTRQLLQSLAAQDSLEFDEDVKLKGLATLLMFAQYQAVSFERKHLQLSQKVPKLFKLLAKLSESYDTSFLSKVVLESAEITVAEKKPFLQAMLSLKTVFMAVQSLIQKALCDPSHQQEVQTHLDMIRDLHPDHFKQSTIFVLKQVQPTARDQILHLLRGSVQKFGESELDVVSALSSNKKVERDAALQALTKPDYLISTKDTGLLHLILLQVLQQGSHDEESLQLLLNALSRFTQTDSDFEMIVALMDQIKQRNLTYSEPLNQRMHELLCVVQVNKPKNACLQAWMILQLSAQTANKNNAYIDFVQKPVNFVTKFTEKPLPAITILLSLFEDVHAFVDYSLVAKQIKKLSAATAKDVIHSTLLEKLISPILTYMKKQPYKNANELLSVFVEIAQGQTKIMSKIVGVSLVQKQWQPILIDLSALHKKLFVDRLKFAELMVTMAVTSHCRVKRTFACQVLISLHHKGKLFQQSQLSSRIMMGVILVLLNESDKIYREYAIQLAEEVLQMQTRAAKDKSIETLDLFTDTEKPTSAQKQPAKPTPMKPKSVNLLLQDLLDAKSEIIMDQSQLKHVLSKHQNQAVFEEILRTLLDFPTFALKQKLITVLSLPVKHAVIFYLNLSQMLQKLFVQAERIGFAGGLNYLKSLGSLISHLQENAQKSTQKEVLSSLTLPFLKYIVDKKVLPEMIFGIFDHDVLVTDILTNADQRTLKEIFKLFLKAADTKLKHLFINRTSGIYKGSDLAQCLVECQHLELALETILQMSPPASSTLCDQAVIILNKLVQKHINKEDSAYLIELSCQLVLASLPAKDMPFKAITALCKEIWQNTKQIVETCLQNEGDGVVNPFDEFMQDDNDDVDLESEDRADLLPSLQVAVSLTNLLTSFELRDGEILQTTILLGDIASHIVLICSKKEETASIQSQIKSQLYFFYQSLILRTIQKCQGFLVCNTIIVDYINACTKLIDSAAMSKQLLGQDLVVNVIKNAPEYTSLVCFALVLQAGTHENEITEQGLIKVDANPALLLLQEVLIWQLDYYNDLTTIRDFFYLLHQTNLTSVAFVEQQTDLLFKDYKCSFSSTCDKLVQARDSKERRKIVYLACAIFTQWFQKTGQFISRLAVIAGSQMPSEEVQNQLLQILLSSYILREQVTQLLVANTSQSLLRLQSVIQKWQQALNEMMSLQIHIKLVIQVLNIPVQALQINTLCLLLDKLASFSGNWFAKAPADLQRIVVQLVKLTIDLLNKKQQEQIAQLLLTVLARTASTYLPREVQLATLTTTMQQHKGSLQLQTQAVLTEMTLMETYSLQVLDYFHLYLQHTLEGFNTKETFFVDTYKHALLKSLVSITQIFLKFLSAQQLEQIIGLSIMCASEGVIITKEGDSVEMILENITSEAVNLKKVVLQATMNSYSLLVSQTGTKGFNLLADRYFQQLLAPVIRRLPQSFISEHHSKFVVFFKQMYGLPLQVASCTKHIVDCFNAFILKMNEETLRPIIIALAKWSTKEPKRKLVFFEILCGCLDTLREFFVPMLQIYFDSLASTFKDCFEGLNVATKLVKRSHSAANESNSIELLTVVCKLTELNYKYDVNAFIQNDYFETLCDPISDLFELSGVANFAQFIDVSVKPLILEMDERTSDDSMWQKLNLALLMKSRSENWETRLAVLSVIDHLFEKMRERYLVILNDTIPFICELLEDENERVELAAKTIVNRIENLTGESINEYLK